MLNVAPDRFTLQSMEKKLEESYKEYAIRWKAVASQVKPPLTHRETNSYFVDTLPSPYYDMLIGNAFPEFGDLLYAVRRIEYGIKKGRIASTEVGVLEQRRSVTTSILEQHPAERETKENSMRKKKLFKTFLIHHKSSSLHPSHQFREGIQTSTQTIPKVTKGRGLRCTIHSLYLMPSCFQCWFRNAIFSLYRLNLESLLILNGMISMSDVNTMAGFKDILQKAAHHSKTKFRL